MRKVGFGVIGRGVISTAYLKAAQRFANLERVLCNQIAGFRMNAPPNVPAVGVGHAQEWWLQANNGRPFFRV